MFHSVTIIGNLGRDPDLRYTPAGQAVCSFNVASNRSYTNSQGEKVKETIWFRVSVWGKMAEVCSQYLKKGRTVHVEGRLNADPATGGPKVFSKQDGSSGTSFEVTAHQVTFLGGRSESQGEGDGSYEPAAAGAPGNGGAPAAGGDEWDDL